MPRRRDKTYLMQLIERDHPGKSIRQIMIDAYIEHGTEKAAAAAIGVTQQSFNNWKFRLGIENDFVQSDNTFSTDKDTT